QVSQQDVERLLAQRRQGVVCRGEADGFIALRGERFDEDDFEFNLIVNDQDSANRFSVYSELGDVPVVVTGRTMRTVVPCPTSLSISIVPRCSSTMRRQIANPRPVPFPSGLVVKKESQMRSRFSRGMPTPVSTNSICTAGAPLRSATLTRVVSGPPTGIASAAFVRRFRNNCLSCWRSA